MRRLNETRAMCALLNLVTPLGVLEADQEELLEDLQERHLEAESRDRVRRAESRATRRYIEAQPKKVVTLDRVTPPGAPYAIAGDFTHGLPREWVGSQATRVLVRRA